jgi:hypothetical protein
MTFPRNSISPDTRPRQWAIATHLLDVLRRAVLCYQRSKFFKQSSRQRFDKVEIVRFVQALAKVFCYPSNIGQCWGNEIDCRDIRNRWP